MYIRVIRSITIKTSFLLHKNSPGLISGGYNIDIPPSLRPWIVPAADWLSVQ